MMLAYKHPEAVAFTADNEWSDLRDYVSDYRIGFAKVQNRFASDFVRTH